MAPHSPPTCSDAELITSVEAQLESLSATVHPQMLREAVAHALLGGGKRVRPLLCLRSCVLASGDWHAALHAACAFELVHAFSLVHDDLPALDNDSMRRGRPTVHIAFGESMAILAGDMLHALAFQSAAASEKSAAVLDILSAATAAMIEGQVFDTEGGFSEGLDEPARLDLVHTNKTGALLRGACRAGAIIGGGDASTMKQLDQFGGAIGLMFQVVDDLLDETQSSAHLGKKAGKDRAQGKLTWPSVHGLDRTREKIAELAADALNALEPFGANADPLREITAALKTRTR